MGMILKGYGMELVRLKHEHIELVRQKRNSVYVREHMEYRDEITPEMQENWFISINNMENNYFLIRHQNRFIGLIYGAEINWEKGITGNGGVFIWEEELGDTGVVLGASLLLTDFSFYLNQQSTSIKILKGNHRAIRFNTRLGYKLLPNQENENNQKYILTRDSYFSVAGMYCRNYYVKKYGDIHQCTLSDIDEPAIQNILRICETLPKELRSKFRLIIEE